MRFMSIARRWGFLVLGAVGIVVGVILLLPRPEPVSFGWAAYAPLSNTTFIPFVPGSYVAGALILAVGAALAAGWAGFALGRRTKRRGIPQ